MASKKSALKDQVRALEALANLRPLGDDEAAEVNGGATAAPSPIKPLRGTGAIAQRIGGTGAIAIRGTGAVAVIRGTGAVAVRRRHA